MACQDRGSSKGLVTNYGEAGGGATKRDSGGGGGHVKFYPYKKEVAENV